MNLTEILRRFKASGQSGDTWEARCPAHDDQRASLSISNGDNGGVVVHCHAGCSPETVVAAVGLTLMDLMPSSDGHANGNGKSSGRIKAVYDYKDESGAVVLQVVRFTPKDFRQRRPKSGGGWEWKVSGTRQVLYRLPELLAADPSHTVIIVEGEKDADRLAKLGLVVTTSPGGAGKWRSEYAEFLRGRPVVILVDNDQPGQQHGQQVAKSLHGFAKSIKIVELPGVPEKGDVSDYLDQGHNLADLVSLVDETPEWIPTATTPTTATPAVQSVAAGTLVKAMDRDNFGTVVSDNGQTCVVHFSSPTGESADVELPKSQLVTQDGRRLDTANDSQDPPVEYVLMTCAQLMAADVTQEYLVDGLIPESQPVIVAGPKKSLKTSLLLALALSLATATRFLGEFVVKQAVAVCIMTGESGLATVKETIIRIAAAMTLDPTKIENLLITESLPHFGSPSHVEGVRLMVVKHALKALIVDPAYMAMDGTDAGNLFTQGTQLRAVSEACREGGCCLILAHHTRKNLAQPFGIPELEDIAWAGFQEFARAWMLVNRRERYLPGTGTHRLWLSCGGSAGHGSLHGLNIEEGRPPDRIWDARLVPFDELKQNTDEERQKARDESSQQQLEHDRKIVVQAMVKYPNGETKTTIRDGTGLNNPRFSRAMASLVDNGTAVLTTIQKGGRKSPRDAYKLQEVSES